MLPKTFLAKALVSLTVFNLALNACKPASTSVAQPTQSMEQQNTKPPAAVPAQAETSATGVTATEAALDPWSGVDPSGQAITFWHPYNEGHEQALLEIVDEFNKSNEWGITVQAEHLGSYNNIFKKMLSVLNTSYAPDLVAIYQHQAAAFQLASGLVDMSTLVNSIKWGLSSADKNDFFSGIIAQDVYPNFGNARLGFPINRFMEVMYYNTDWLKELGYDTPPTTPNQFKEMACKAAQQPFSKATTEGSIGYELSADASRFASWTFAFGGDVFDSKTGQYTFNYDAALAAMSFLQDLFTNNCAILMRESFGDQTDFGAGRLLFTVDSSSGLPFYASTVKNGANFSWSVAAIPHTTKNPVMNVYGASVSMPKTTPERELAAWLFIKYYTSPEIQTKWAKVSQSFPVRASVADRMTDYFDANPAYKSAFELLQYAKFEPSTPDYDFVRSMVKDAMAAIVDGADIQSTLDKLTEDCNANLAEQLAQIK